MGIRQRVVVRHLKRKLNLNANNKEVACGGPIPESDGAKVIELNFGEVALAA